MLSALAVASAIERNGGSKSASSRSGRSCRNGEMHSGLESANPVFASGKVGSDALSQDKSL